jgi:hypothetical protein
MDDSGVIFATETPAFQPSPEADGAETSKKAMAKPNIKGTFSLHREVSMLAGHEGDEIHRWRFFESVRSLIHGA